ncbi:hypothetical protein F01_420420 [Burkholderia cenocepacia]|nr:hypothetical protein F01_420420 [Burkholderia cenocepacia]
MARHASRRGRRATRGPAGQDAAPDRRRAVRLDADAEWHRRLQEGRSDEGRGRYARVVVGDDDERARAGAVLRRRGGGRDGLARRLQLPVGMGVRHGGRAGRGRVRARRLTRPAGARLAGPGPVPLGNRSAILGSLSLQTFIRVGS